MNLHSMSDTKLTTNELVQLAIISAITIAGKEAVSFIPNVHPVVLFLIVTTLVYGWKAMLVAMCFNLAEFLLYGFGIWSIIYLYIWPLVVILAMVFRKETSRIFWAILAGGFGLIFGALCSIPFIFISGLKAATAAWISGIPFDLIHGISNFIIVYFLLEPLRKLLMKLKSGSLK